MITLILMALVTLVIVIIYVCMKNSRGNIKSLPLNPSTITINDKWVHQAIQKAAEDITKENFNLIGKPIHAVNGNYDTDFVLEMNSEFSYIKKSILNGVNLKDDFCHFISTRYAAAKNSDLRNIIIDYMVGK